MFGVFINEKCFLLKVLAQVLSQLRFCQALFVNLNLREILAKTKVIT